MRTEIFNLTYFETYYFANIINNILREPFAYLRSLEDFFGENNYKAFLEPFPKKTRLHDFIAFIIDSLNFEEINMEQITTLINRKRKLWIEIAFDHYDFGFQSFDNWLLNQKRDREKINDDDVVEYLNELQLSGPYEQLLERMSEEIFFILFLNRQTLQRFNSMIAFQIENRALEELDTDDLLYFRKSGILKRVTIPSWVQRAVLHRDRGLCVSCSKDISGLLNIGFKENFDHIIPLALGGINDVTNIQLLCETCNKSKRATHIATSLKYEKWY